MAGSDGDFLVAAGAAVGLRGPIRLHPAQFGGPAGEWVGDESRLEATGGHAPVSPPGKTLGVALTGLALSVRPEPLASTTLWARRRLVSSIVAFARIAEDASLDALLVEDAAFDGRSLGAFSLLGHLAGQTTRIGLGVVCPAHSIRTPSIVAKLIASLDIVSGGRGLAALTPGDGGAAGALEEGWSPTDLEAAEVVRRSLVERAPSFSGAHFTLDVAWNEPRVAARPTPLYRVVRSATGGAALVPMHRSAATEGAPGEVPLVVVGPLDSPEAVADRVRFVGGSPPGPSAVVIEWPGPLVEAQAAEVIAAAVAARR